MKNDSTTVATTITPEMRAAILDSLSAGVTLFRALTAACGGRATTRAWVELAKMRKDDAELDTACLAAPHDETVPTLKQFWSQPSDREQGPGIAARVPVRPSVRPDVVVCGEWDERWGMP